MIVYCPLVVSLLLSSLALRLLTTFPCSISAFPSRSRRPVWWSRELSARCIVQFIATRTGSPDRSHPDLISFATARIVLLHLVSCTHSMYQVPQTRTHARTTPALTIRTRLLMLMRLGLLLLLLLLIHTSTHSTCTDRRTHRTS